MVVWLCRCNCPHRTELRVDAQNLSSRNTTSCGCAKIEHLAQNPGRNLQHGGYGTPTYKCWIAMRARCNDPNDDHWPRYGGRGITVDPRWDRYENFLVDMGERPQGKTIDRIDNDGPYAKTNCRWATPAEQANNRRGNRLITYSGRTQTLAHWAREFGLTPNNLALRLRRGLSIEVALTLPIDRRRATDRA